jgi:hypothetical protein
MGIYSVSYLKSHKVVHSFIRDHGGSGLMFAAFVLLVVASLSGAWA